MHPVSESLIAAQNKAAALFAEVYIAVGFSSKQTERRYLSAMSCRLSVGDVPAYGTPESLFVQLLAALLGSG
jgi:hypothetical protein